VASPWFATNVISLSHPIPAARREPQSSPPLARHHIHPTNKSRPQACQLSLSSSATHHRCRYITTRPPHTLLQSLTRNRIATSQFKLLRSLAPGLACRCNRKSCAPWASRHSLLHPLQACVVQCVAQILVVAANAATTPQRRGQARQSLLHSHGQIA